MSGDASGGHRYPESKEEAAAIQQAAASELRGRELRVTGFRLREAGEGDVGSPDPRRYVLEVYFGTWAYFMLVTEADVEALSGLTQSMLSGWTMPLEARP